MTFTLIDIDKAAQYILALTGEHKVIGVNGEMGAGKTTLIMAMCKLLGVLDSMSSPTFPLINEYLTKNDETIYHIDAYRLNSVSEAIDAGIEESIYSGNYCFIEWPENIEPFLPEDILQVFLKKTDDATRQLSTKVATSHIRLKS